MRRIGIFCFYDNDGVVDSYIDYLLQEIVSVVDRIIIVVNGKLTEIGKCIFLKYSDEIVVRDNIGFDAGAYADILLYYLSERDLSEYDELVLCNDTFYGPFVPMKTIFDSTDKESIDFWGMNFCDKGALTHIQSYFLVFKKKILRSGDLLYYFRNNISIFEKDINNVYGLIEPGLWKYLTEKEYQYATYTNTELLDAYQYAHICIQRYGLPILKRKSFSPKYFDMETQILTLQYIHNETEYDINNILENAKRCYGFLLSKNDVLNHECCVTRTVNRAARAKSSDELLKSVEGKDFYIYGAGIIARGLVQILFLKEMRLKGFIVSDDQPIEEEQLFNLPVKHYHEIPLNSTIIIGVSNMLAIDIREKIGSSHSTISIWETK